MLGFSWLPDLIEAQRNAVSPGQAPLNQPTMTLADQESFMDFLNVIKTVVPIGVGTLGGPIGVLAGMALNAVSQIASHSNQSTLTGPNVQQGSVERAILAEATQHALKVDPRLEESVLSHIKDTVMQALPVVKKIATRVAGAALEPALQAALDMLRKSNQDKGAEGVILEPFRPPIHYSEATFELSDKKAVAFLAAAKSSMEDGQLESAWDYESQEGFFDVIKTGIALAGQSVSVLAQHGLPTLFNALANSNRTEALETGDSDGSFKGPLAQRALVADAALSAVMELPPDVLEEADFFGALGKAVQVFAPAVIKYAPLVAQNVLPLVDKIMGAESSLIKDPTNLTGQLGISAPMIKRSTRFSFPVPNKSSPLANGITEE